MVDLPWPPMNSTFVSESDSTFTGRPLPPVVAAIFRKAIGGSVHEIIPYTNTPAFLSTVVPSSNTVSTANEMSRFAEIWRRGGELDGVRIMSPETMRGAVEECRRLRPDFAVGLRPARWGTGFMLGNNRFGPFGRNAPAAFGGHPRVSRVRRGN